jgi:hypothetical protein
MKLRLYLILQGYFGYDNDRTHDIKVVALVVKITIHLTYGMHGFKKKESKNALVAGRTDMGKKKFRRLKT